jgi:hypothetical protein
LLFCCIERVGVAITVKSFVLVTVPPEVVTEIVPVEAPGITNPTSVSPLLDITNAVTPPILKAEAVLRFVPTIVTKVPAEPEAGENEVIAGATIPAFAYNFNPARMKNKKYLFIVTILEKF